MTENDKENINKNDNLENMYPVLKLDKINNLMQNKSINELPEILMNVLGCGMDSLSYFKYKVEGSLWKGYIYCSRNTLYGSLFGYFDGKPFIVRGMPKIYYSEKTDKNGVLNNKCYIEHKYDGTNIIVFNLPNGVFWGKTRETSTIFREGFKGNNWGNLLEETGYIDKLKQLTDLGYAVILELYGNKNKGEFITYDVDIDIVVLDIIDMESLSFIPIQIKHDLCKQYGLPFADFEFLTDLTIKKYKELECYAKKFNHHNGYEGFIAKYYNKDIGDIVMGKIKCVEIREKCSRNKLPMRFIWKALRKCRDANIDFMVDDEINLNAYNFVLNELKEDFTDETINKSVNIEKVRLALNNPDKLDKPNVDISKFDSEKLNKIFKKIEDSGVEVSVENKGKVLSLASQILILNDIHFKGKNLFNGLLAYIEKNKT